MIRPVWYRRKRSSILCKMLSPATFLLSVNLIYYETICIHFNCICIPFLILLDRFLMLTLISHAYIQRLMVPAAGIIFPQNIICPIVYDWFYPPFNSGHHAKLVCDIYMIMKWPTAQLIQWKIFMWLQRISVTIPKLLVFAVIFY